MMLTHKLLLLLSFCGLALANTEQVVISPDGQRPYLVVTPDTEGASKRVPGVYVADAVGGWHHIVAGNLLSGRFTQGVLSQLPVSQFDQRYASVAVIDGKIVLFTVNTKVDSPNSSVVLGSV